MISRTAIAVAASVGFSLLPAASYSQVTEKNGLYDFRVKLVAGKKISYMNSVVALGGITVNLPISMKVLSVTGGKATVETVTGPGTMNGQSMGQNAVTEKAVIDMKGQPAGAGSTGTGTVFGSIPSKPIKVGATWTGKAPTNNSSIGMKDITATYTFVGVKNVKGKQVAEIKITIKGAGESSMSGSGFVHILTADGLLATSKLSMALKMAGSEKPMTFTANTYRK